MLPTLYLPIDHVLYVGLLRLRLATGTLVWQWPDGHTHTSVMGQGLWESQEPNDNSDYAGIYIQSSGAYLPGRLVDMLPETMLHYICMVY